MSKEKKRLIPPEILFKYDDTDYSAVTTATFSGVDIDTDTDTPFYTNDTFTKDKSNTLDTITESFDIPVLESEEILPDDASVFNDEEPTIVQEPDNKKSILINLGIFLLILLILILCWAVAGLLMSMKLINYYDLGYTWFNQHIFTLF